MNSANVAIVLQGRANWTEQPGPGGTGAILEALEPWPGTSAILVDTSGSMEHPLSREGKTRYVDVAALLGAMAVVLSPGGYHVGTFDTEFRWVPGIVRRDSVLANMARICARSGATYAWKAPAAMREGRVKVARIVLLSDMQCYNIPGPEGPSLAAEWWRHRREVNPDAYLYSIDLAGYGTSQFRPEDRRTVLLSGWSESVLDFVRHYENGRSAVDEIKAAGPGSCASGGGDEHRLICQSGMNGRQAREGLF